MADESGHYEVTVLSGEGVKKFSYPHDDGGLERALVMAWSAWEVGGFESFVELVAQGDRFFVSNFGPAPMCQVRRSEN